MLFQRRALSVAANARMANVRIVQSLDKSGVNNSHEVVLHRWDGGDDDDGDDDGGSGRGPGLQMIRHRPQSLSAAQHFDSLVLHFMPKDYPESVATFYMPYAKWQFAGTVASSISSVLSTQSLLYAVGLGAGSIPMAAALNWVMKDGIGQLGGVAFASFINRRFDADPKRFRLFSAVAQDAAVLIEIASPLAPALFLPIASIANVGKNVSWLSASATRAAIHRSMLQQENMADVTVKAGTQTTLASTVGMGAGIVLSPLVGTETMSIMAAFSALSAAHLWCQYRSLSHVVLVTLNEQRLELILHAFAAAGYVADAVPAPDAVCEREGFVRQLLRGYQSGAGSWLGGAEDEKTGSGNGTASESDSYAPIVVGPHLPDFGSSVQQWRATMQTFSGHPYLLRVSTDCSAARAASSGCAIMLLLAEEATSADVLRAYLHAVLVQRRLRAGGFCDADDVVRDELPRAMEAAPQLLAGLAQQGWDCENLFLELEKRRVSFAPTTNNSSP